MSKDSKLSKGIRARGTDKKLQGHVIPGHGSTDGKSPHTAGNRALRSDEDPVLWGKDYLNLTPQPTRVCPVTIFTKMSRNAVAANADDGQ